MARKPITAYSGGKGPRQRIWEAIRKLATASDAPFTERDIWGETHGNEIDIDGTAIRDYRRCLVAAGVLELVDSCTDRGQPSTYRLAKNEGLEAPRVRRDGTRVTQGLAQEAMWRTLRMLPGDTNYRELAAHASTPAVPVAEVAADAYLKALCRAGYLGLTVVGKGHGNGGTPARYRLLHDRNTGPRPPMICRTKVVYDPNEDRVVWAPVVTDEDAIYG